jgi:hypothetical protein
MMKRVGEASGQLSEKNASSDAEVVIEKHVPSKRCFSPMLISEFLHRRTVPDLWVLFCTELTSSSSLLI